VIVNVIRIVVMSSKSSSERHPPPIDFRKITERRSPGDAGIRNRSLSQLLLKMIEEERTRGNLDEALKYADQAVQLDPNYAPAWHLRGDVRVDRGETQSAVSDFSMALQLDPMDPRAIYDRGCALYDLQKWEDCAKDFAQAYQNTPSLRTPSQLRFCLARSRLGQRAAAEKDLATFVTERNSLDPWSRELLRFVAGLSDEEILFAEAERVPTECRCQAYFYAGELRLLSDDPEQAKVYFGRCLEIGSKRERECASAAAELRALERK
jgi:tetratricopeptide (TPR) repeat protein